MASPIEYIKISTTETAASSVQVGHDFLEDLRHVRANPEDAVGDPERFNGEPYKSLKVWEDAAQNNPQLQGRLEQLLGYYEHAFQAMEGNTQYPHGEKENIVTFPSPSAERLKLTNGDATPFLHMSVKNLNGTGLSFGLNFDKDDLQALVLTNLDGKDGQSADRTMSREQVIELAKFCCRGGIFKDPSHIALPDNIKIADHEDLDLKEIFNEAFNDELRSMSDHEQALEGGQNDNSPEDNPYKTYDVYGSGNSADDREECAGAASEGNEWNQWIQERKFNPDMKAMKAAVTKGAKEIMGDKFRDRLYWRRNLDGSMTLVAYDDASHVGADGKAKDGYPDPKKAFVVKINANPPRVGFRAFGGHKLGGAEANMIIGGLVAVGCSRVTIPERDVYGAEGRKAIMQAIGTKLCVPALKWSDGDDGNKKISLKDLKVIIEAHDEDYLKKDGITPEASLKWKMQLVREVRKNLAYRKSIGDIGEDEKTAFDNVLGNLDGEIKFTKYKSSVQSGLDKIVEDGCKNQGWTVLDVVCAMQAQAALLTKMGSGEFYYDPLNPDAGAFQKEFKKLMEEQRVDVINQMNKAYDEGGQLEGKSAKRNSAAGRVFGDADRNLKKTIETLGRSYGDAASKMNISFYKGCALTEESWNEFKKVNEPRYTDTPQAAQGRGQQAQAPVQQAQIRADGRS